jgi:hypothetical protein
MAETKVCKQCGKYNMRDADNCIQCRKALPEFALPTNVIKTRGQLSIIFGMAVGIIVVLNTLGISTILFGVYVGGYGGLLAWILVFKFRNNFPDDLTSTLNWLFPFRKMNLLKFIGVWIAVAIISIVFSVIASM